MGSLKKKDLFSSLMVALLQSALYRPRSEVLHVEWGKVELLSILDSRDTIFTFGVACCYAQVGVNPTGNIILAHHLGGTTLSQADEAVCERINRENIQTGRHLNSSDFIYSYYLGPSHRARTQPNKHMYYDLAYTRGNGLSIIAYNDMSDSGTHVRIKPATSQELVALLH